MRRTSGFVKEPCLRPAEGRYPPTAVLQALPSNFYYSPNLVEEEFYEVRAAARNTAILKSLPIHPTLL